MSLISYSITVTARVLVALGLFAVTSVQAADRPLLWQLQAPGGKVSYLFGTVHTDDARVNDFAPAVLTALGDVDVFMMETLPPKDQSVYLNPDQQLQERLSAAELEQVRALAEVHAIGSMAMQMKPWLLAVVFDLPKPQGPYTQDIQLYAKARDLGREVKGLETAEEHFGLLDGLSQEEQMGMLRAVLKRSQRDKERDYELLINAYLKGDPARIVDIDTRMTGNLLPPALWAKLRIKLLDDRNDLMAPRIDAEAREKSVFVAVGAAHLAGKRGLLAQLQKAGYTLKRLK
ncbi:MAG TPA: TraB/GumN family protein [Methylovorus sp.]|nr:TraB/GumN family protein [Methylovorus sp.]